MLSFFFILLFFFFFFFFFSSRRRHTRFDCDWSSDVCSSDLPPPVVRWSVDRGAEAGPSHVHDPQLDLAGREPHPVRDSGPVRRDRATRSEERRVGKECRSRWSPDHEKKKNKRKKKRRNRITA